MGNTSVEMIRSYSSFSGCDINGIINGEVFSTMQAISYAIQREKAPIYVMGSKDPRSFSRGKRGIAGTIISLLFDRHILFNNVFMGNRFIAGKNEVMPSVDDLNNATQLNDLGRVGGGDALDETFDESNISGNYQLNQAWYVDQLVPFDIVIVAANEYGQSAQMRVYGVEILNEGSGFSVDDISLESQMTYVCRTISPWRPMGKWDMTTGQFSPPDRFGV